MVEKVTITGPDDAKINAMLDIVGQMKRYQAVDKMVSAMGKVALVRARILAPKSAENPKRPDKKRSKKQRQQANWDIVYYKTLRVVTRKTNTGAYAVLGPKWPDGNKIHFNTARKKGSRKVVYWGVDQNRREPSIRNHLIQACDETQAQMVTAARAALEKFLHQNFGGT